MIIKGLSIAALAAAVLFASTPDISITGTVTDGKAPLEGAIVSLVSDSTIADTTGTDGTFKLGSATAVTGPSNLHFKNDIRTGIRGSSLCFTLSSYAEKGAISLYNGGGQRVMHIPMNNLTAQTHHVTLPVLSPGFYMLSISAGNVSTDRRLICIGSAFYLDCSANSESGNNGNFLTKQAQAGADKVKVKKTGYITKTVDITGTRIENLEIALQKEGGEPCNGGKWASTDVSKKGPFETVSENVSGAVLYRPKNMLTGCLYPIITWGHGAMGSPGDYDNLCAIMASHGFVVISSSATDVQEGGNSGNQFRNKMVQVAEWVVQQNSNSSSVLYQKIDTGKIGAAGHSQGGYGATEAGQNPLITTSVSSCGAVGSDKLKGPALLLCGSKDNTTDSRCSAHPTGAYNGINNVPVMLAEHHNADHGWCMDMMGSSSKDNPHEMLMATVAWFRYHLMGDEAYRSWFYGADCTLCKHSNWSVKRKGMD